jgi:transposase
LVRALLAYKRGEPRVCAIVSAPTPEDEDNRRLCRERKALTAERIQHVNRSKDCCSLKAYPITSRFAATGANDLTN